LCNDFCGLAVTALYTIIVIDMDVVKHGKKDNSTMPTHPQGFQLLTWQVYVACKISIGSDLIQQRYLRDLNGLFDTSGIKVILGAKLRDVIGYCAKPKSFKR